MSSVTGWPQVSAIGSSIPVDNRGFATGCYPLLWRALISLDPDIAPIARSCLLTIQLRGRI